MEMAHFKKYSSFSEKRYAFVRLKWQISVQPLHNIIAEPAGKARQRSSIAKEIW